MQSLNDSHKLYQDQISFNGKEIKINNLWVFHTRGTRDALKSFEKIVNEKKKYVPTFEQILKVDGLSSYTTKILFHSNFIGHYRKDLILNEMCTSQNSNCNTSLKFISNSVPIITNDTDSWVNKSIEISQKYDGKRNRIGNIVSTNHTGHIIERKSENCPYALSKTDFELKEDCDSNDNIISCEGLKSEMCDINDNPQDGINNKEEETSLSENGQSGKSDCEEPCGIGVLERLIRSHPVWFLPGIQRAGAVHLLQGKEEGNFVVRQSSQPDTMAVSVRLPAGKGPYIEHYLIQAVDGQLSLESSENVFESIPSLIAHYCQCCDELPVQLSLPRTICEAKNRQQLSSLALLGQEFWRYPMANPRSPDSQNSSPKSNKSDCFISSDGMKKIFKEEHEIILDLVPLQQDFQPSSLLSTFKSSPTESVCSALVNEIKPKRPHTLDLLSVNSEKTGSTLAKTPPQPPPRWTKPSHNALTNQFSSSTSAAILTKINSQSEFMSDECLKPKPREYALFRTETLDYDHNISSPQSDQTNLKSFAFEKEQNSFRHSRGMNKPQLISPVSDTTGFISKSFERDNKNYSVDLARTDKMDRIFKRSFKRESKLKESTHYQESDILAESPTLFYYKSNVADKQSDYEDIWATDSFITFKPCSMNSSDQEAGKLSETHEISKPPDLLERLDNTINPSSVEKKDDKSPLNQNSQKFSACDFDRQNLEDDGKQSSPFYAEPADALIVRRKGKLSLNKSRHSDPFSFNNWSVQMNPYFSGGNILGRIDSQNDLNEDLSWKAKSSLSFDNIINLKKKEVDLKQRVHQKNKNVFKAKPVRPPKVFGVPMEKNRQNWTIDSSWEFIGNEEAEREGERKFPSLEQQMDSDDANSKYTVQEIILKRFPHFNISQEFWTKGSGSKEKLSCQQMPAPRFDNSKNSARISAYDNLAGDRFNFFKAGYDSDKDIERNCDTPTSHCSNLEQHHKISENETIFSKNQVLSDTLRFKKRMDCGSVTEDNEDTQTIFSEPWDSSRWENLLPSNNHCSNIEPQVEPFFSEVGSNNTVEISRNTEKIIKRRVFREEMPLNLYRSRDKNKDTVTTGASIRSYALHLASDKSTTFAQNIDNFIECTLESKETNPQIVMRNMRQFMSGMKNYLVKHGEREFEKQVEKERMKLKSTEFLNLDAILESVMHKLVVRPLREHLYKLFVDEYIKNGAIQLLYENLSFARTKTLHDLGLKSKITPPSPEALEMICHYISKLQEVDSPLEKLDHLLASVSTIIYSVKNGNQEKPGITLGVDDILPLFVWVLVQSGFIAAEIEAEYMWGLLHPSLLSGEGCYYLTTLSSAVHVLKNLKSCDLNRTKRLALNEWNCGDLKSVLKIIVPDELHGSILTKTLPVKPNMTTKDVCKIIAHKIRITNPQDYGLFRLVDGEETLLNDSECPQDIKCQLVESGKHCTLAYKRIDAKIGWPRTT